MGTPERQPHPGTLKRASFGPTDDLIRRVADSDVTVLIRGERGTGKEQAARAMHAASARRDRPFVKVDCASLASLLDAELFGYDDGATGAGRPRPGRLEFASHGTLFLDHVSKLAAPLQLRLQQVLEERAIASAGAPPVARMDARVIASADEDLEQAVAAGTFRERLRLRLNVVCLTLVPLRQRRDDLPQLTDFFVRRYAARYNRAGTELSAQTLSLLSGYDWPGNLEELDAVVKRIVLLGTEEAVARDLRAKPAPVAPTEAPERPAAVPPTNIPLKALAREAADRAERELIFSTLQRTRWNRREAAELLGISYKALLYKIKRAEFDGVC